MASLGSAAGSSRGAATSSFFLSRSKRKSFLSSLAAHHRLCMGSFNDASYLHSVLPDKVQLIFQAGFLPALYYIVPFARSLSYLQILCRDANSEMSDMHGLEAAPF